VLHSEESLWESDAREAVEHALESAEWDLEKGTVTLVPVADKEPYTVCESLSELHAALEDLAQTGASNSMPFEGGRPVFDIDYESLVYGILMEKYAGPIQEISWDERMVAQREREDPEAAKRGGSDTPANRRGQANGSETPQSEYAVAVIRHVSDVSALVMQHIEFDQDKVLIVLGLLADLRDQLLELEEVETVLDAEAQSLIRRVISDIRHSAPWAIDQLQDLFRHPIIAGATGAALQRYFFS